MKNVSPHDQEMNDLTQTRVHILTASRELLYAAKGALNFCYRFVESSGTEAPHVRAFFKRAINVADDLSSGLKNMDAIKKAAGSAVKPIFSLMEEEMKSKPTATAKAAAGRVHGKRTPTGRLAAEKAKIKTTTSKKTKYRGE